MKKKFQIAFATMAILLWLTACATLENDREEAGQILIAFFDLLNQGRYDEAAELYGGSYESLVDLNPSLDPQDRGALLKNGCEVNGFQCLPVLKADFKETNLMDGYIFIVQFEDAHGGLFVRQPLNSPPESAFEYLVQKASEGGFVVMDLPVYVP